jgi:hypothetical protein
MAKGHIAHSGRNRRYSLSPFTPSIALSLGVIGPAQTAVRATGNRSLPTRVPPAIFCVGAECAWLRRIGIIQNEQFSDVPVLGVQVDFSPVIQRFHAVPVEQAPHEWRVTITHGPTDSPQVKLPANRSEANVVVLAKLPGRVAVEVRITAQFVIRGIEIHKENGVASVCTENGDMQGFAQENPACPRFPCPRFPHFPGRASEVDPA